MKRLIDKGCNRKPWPIKALVVSVVMGLTMTLAQGATTTNRKPIGDLEIYKPAKAGTATIFMMLDTSGSMDTESIRADYGNSYSKTCSENALNLEKISAVIYERKIKLKANGSIFLDDDGKQVIIKDLSRIKETIEYTPIACTANNVARYSRLVRLKIALIELLADDIKKTDGTIKQKGSVADDYEIGLGNYSYERKSKVGVVLVPTKKLNAQQRVDLIKSISALDAGGGTPTAQAFAESGAYMMGTNTGSSGDSGFSNSVGSSKKDGKYISPLNASECSGNGIYLLTDGEPKNSSDTIAKKVMNASLSYSSSLSVNNCSALDGDNNQAWGCMANYAALLRNSTNNPLNLSIKTATVGFGTDFKGLTGKRTVTINDKTKEVIDCESGSNVNRDTRNLCRLGERRGDNEVKSFGDGGFYYTEESIDIANSLVDFAATLVQIINTAPSGTITIPNDPYRAANQLPYAYLPMLDPDIASSASIWKGNLKKYALDQGTLFGKSDKLLYKDVAGNLSTTTQDLWQNGDFVVDDKTSNNNVAAGGVYAQLRSPKSALGSVRTLYVEDYTSASDKRPILRKLGVNDSGIPQGFDSLVDTVAYSQLNQRRILSFLGFSDVLTNDGQIINSAVATKDLVLTAPKKEVKLLGGVVHSKPVAVSYSATLDANGRITDTRDDYVLFGSMDGALHLVDADTGSEEFAIIPRSMFINQPEAIVEGSTIAKVGVPKFGIDAPWAVATDYNYKLSTDEAIASTVSADAMIAYGGLRMGGEAFYGIDITKKSDPKIVFNLTPAGLNNATADSSFARLGQIWSIPVAAKIRLAKDDDPIDVLVFGGGYDMQYEDDEYVATTASPAKGNAIYIVDASTGALIWSSSNTGSDIKTSSNRYNAVPSMVHSFVGEITVLDRDNDGLMDHLYAADLGGQVFRVDFQNARPEKFGFAEIANFKNHKVTRVLSTMPTNNRYAYRFYERPVVSLYRNQGTGANNGQLFSVVNVISGNRSAPLSTLRDGNTNANRIYGIIDNDITSANLYASDFTPKLNNLTESDLTNLATTLGNTPTAIQKEEAKADMISGDKKGWYYPLTRFDGFNNVRYNKGIGDSVVINNLLFTTVYNPDKQYGTVASCAAKIAGGSERQLYCLPYGICTKGPNDTVDNSINGTGGYVPVGQGIQELTLGAFNKNNNDIKVLIGTTTITDRINAANRADYNTDVLKNTSNIKDLYPGETVRPTVVGGDGSAAEFLFNERYTLQPRAWYEQKPSS